jgi:micrococcal nuclease
MSIAFSKQTAICACALCAQSVSSWNIAGMDCATRDAHEAFGGRREKGAKMMRQWIERGILAAAGLAVGVALGFLVWGMKERAAFSRTYLEGKPVRVLDAVDGDTIILEDRMHVRYRGCDAPETMRFVRDPQPHAEEATERNRMLVKGAWVRLKFPSDGPAVDQHGRLLADVLLDADRGPGPSVPEMLVQEGLARAFLRDLPPADASRMRAAEDAARAARRGIWAAPEAVAAAERGGAPAGPFVASRTGKFVHRPDCIYAKRISPSSLMKFAALDEGLAAGKARCPTCFEGRPGAGAEDETPAAPAVPAGHAAAAAAEAAGAASYTGPFVASRNGKLYHKPDCEAAKLILPANLQKYDTAEAAAASGKEKCARCLGEPPARSAKPAESAPQAAAAAEAAGAASYTGPFVASKGGKFYHKPDCIYAKRIAPANLAHFETEEAARASGKEKCPTCLEGRAAQPGDNPQPN